MADGVAGGGKQVEGVVAEVVVCGEVAEEEGEGGDFVEGSGRVVGFEDWGRGVVGVAGEEGGAEAGADD